MKTKCHLRKKQCRIAGTNQWGILVIFWVFFEGNWTIVSATHSFLISFVATLFFTRERKRGHDTLLHFAFVSQEIKWGQTHNTAMQSDGKSPSRSLQEEYWGPSRPL